jgi:ribosomal protein S18 acetylase RimI-like enzyme
MSASEAPRVALPADLGDVIAGLRALAADLGDPFPMPDATLHKALFGPHPTAFALVAGGQGVALVQPQISTSAGGVLGYVSDLWVAPDARGTGLARDLLGLCARESAARWGALGLRLAVAGDNARARAFYDRLGFVTHARDRIALLTGVPFDRVRDLA